MEHNKKDIRQNYPKEWEKMQEIGIPDRKSAACSEEKVREFWEFVEKNGRLPKWNVNEEKNLYYWCARVIKKQTYPDVVKKLKDMEWGNKTLNESMQNLVDFVKENKRLPRWDIKEEKNLYKKYNILKNNKKGERERFMDVWTEISEVGVIETKGEKNEHHLGWFVGKYGRLPEKKDTEYRNLYQWCLKLAKNASMRKKYPDASDILSEFGWI